MTLKISIQGANAQWRALVPTIRAMTGQSARATFVAGVVASRQPCHEPAKRQPMTASEDVFGVDTIITLNIQLATDADVQLLNAEFRGKNKPTNVLSFPSGEWPPALNVSGTNEVFLGDIIIARETVEREAADQQKSFSAHFTHLIVHGVLHLLGYDHMDKEEEKAMEAIEISILSSLGIANPYVCP